MEKIIAQILRRCAQNMHIDETHNLSYTIYTPPQEFPYIVSA